MLDNEHPDFLDFPDIEEVNETISSTLRAGFLAPMPFFDI